MYVIGTAGHVDHGKSTLIKALTGIDPDRLREEQERGMTIVLGFAWLSLPSGREVSIVDVPGHERFVKNMLAGVGGIDLALLVVAADESVMPQTREHLAILDLLRVRRGMAVIAKKDLVDQEWLELVQAEVEEVLKGTSMEGAPILAVSAVTGEGLEEMKQAIDDLLAKTEPRKDLGRSRLAIDRVFTMSGFGTVVTGTLIDGSLSLGQEVELALSGRRYRVRGLQTHRRKIEKAIPGSRVAVNLSGVSPEDIQRGEVLTIRGWLRPTRAVDAHLRLISDAPRPVPHNFPVTFHLGATETPARVRLLDREQLKPGETGWAQLHLQDPVVVVKGDYFVIRATGYTLGGGNIVDPHAKRHRRRHAPTLERLEVMEQGSAADILVKALEGAEPADLKSLANRANVSLEDTKRLAAETAQEGRLVVLGDGRPGPSSLLYTAPGWNAVTEKARSALSAYHKHHPLRKGAPKEELRSRLGAVAADVSPGPGAADSGRRPGGGRPLFAPNRTPAGAVPCPAEALGRLPACAGGGAVHTAHRCGAGARPAEPAHRRGEGGEGERGGSLRRLCLPGDGSKDRHPYKGKGQDHRGRGAGPVGHQPQVCFASAGIPGPAAHHPPRGRRAGAEVGHVP